jgi:hypothetical protein
MELEPRILVFERAKTFHALDRAAIVIGHAPTEDKTDDMTGEIL